MYMASSFLYSIVTSEKEGVFFEESREGNRFLVSKLPIDIIKNIKNNGSAFLWVFISKSNPELIAVSLDFEGLYACTMPQRWISNKNKLTDEYFDEIINFVVYDDTDSPTLYGDALIKTDFKSRRMKTLLKNSPDKNTNFDFDNITRFLDVCEGEISKSRKIKGKDNILNFRMKLSFSNQKSIAVIHANQQGSSYYNLIEDEDGGRQERQLYQSLCLMSSSSTYHSPTLVEGINDKERELTDILTVTDSGSVIVFESKAQEIMEGYSDKSLSRLVSASIHHCNKALTQIEGVAKRIKKGGINVHDAKTKEKIKISNDVRIFAVVAIDIFRNSNKWDEVIDRVEKLSKKHGIVINIITVSDLIYEMKLCKSNIDDLIKLLYDRHLKVVANRTLSVMYKDSSLPPIQMNT